MDRIIRCITSDGSLMAAAIDSSDMVYTAQKIHSTSPTATAALGRLLTGASIMGTMLKQDKASILLKVNGSGPIGNVVAIADSHGNVRGYVQNPQVQVDRKTNGKLDVGAAVGTNGLLTVVRDMGENEPYVGQIQLVSGEIAEDITEYYAVSEQIPTVCALGVLVNKENHQAMLSGGLLIQVLPGADNAAIDKLEENVRHLEPITTMLAKGLSIEEICKKALQGFNMEILDEYKVNYACTCSKDRVEQALSSLNPEDIRTLADEKGYAEVKCQYCNRTYCFSKEDLEQLAQNLEKNKK